MPDVNQSEDGLIRHRATLPTVPLGNRLWRFWTLVPPPRISVLFSGQGSAMQETKDDKKPESSPRKQSMGERLTEGLRQQQDKEPSGLQAALAFLHRKR
jgi:hypothetical protein